MQKHNIHIYERVVRAERSRVHHAWHYNNIKPYIVHRHCPLTVRSHRKLHVTLCSVYGRKTHWHREERNQFKPMKSHMAYRRQTHIIFNVRRVPLVIGVVTIFEIYSYDYMKWCGHILFEFIICVCVMFICIYSHMHLSIYMHIYISIYVTIMYAWIERGLFDVARRRHLTTKKWDYLDSATFWTQSLGTPSSSPPPKILRPCIKILCAVLTDRIACIFCQAQT